MRMYRAAQLTMRLRQFAQNANDLKQLKETTYVMNTILRPGSP